MAGKTNALTHRQSSKNAARPSDHDDIFSNALDPQHETTLFQTSVMTPKTVGSLQRSIGNRATRALVQKNRPQITQKTRNAAPVQRAISIGREHLRRNLELTDFEQVFSYVQDKSLAKKAAQDAFKLYLERDTIYTFNDMEHFKGYFTNTVLFPPFVSKVKDDELQEGHKLGNQMRFNSIYGPSNTQMPTHAPGVNTIPQQQLPPSGPGHHWGQGMNGTNQQYVMWQNQLQPPPHTTEFSSFGNPNNPSIWSHQGNYNMGGRVMPTSNSKYLTDITRNKTSYGNLPSETNQVRGHPMSLNQQQISTNPKTPRKNFDNSSEVYTRESDGTKGGFSTFRYNQVERPSQKNMQPFNQVNVSSNPYAQTGMGISDVDRIQISSQQPNGSYQQMDFDNKVDYRNQIGSGNKFHTRLGQHVQSNNFPYEQVHEYGEDFDDPQRHSYPGYMSPPPTPFLIPQLQVEDPNVLLDGQHHQGELILHNGDAHTIVEATYNKTTNKTQCKVVKGFTSEYKF